MGTPADRFDTNRVKPAAEAALRQAATASADVRPIWGGAAAAASGQ